MMNMAWFPHSLSSEDGRGDHWNTKEPRQRETTIGDVLLSFLRWTPLLTFSTSNIHSPEEGNKQPYTLVKMLTLWEAVRTPTPRFQVDLKHCEREEGWRPANDEMHLHECHLRCQPAVRQKYPSESNLYLFHPRPAQVAVPDHALKKPKKLSATVTWRNNWISLEHKCSHFQPHPKLFLLNDVTRGCLVGFPRH